MSDFTNKLIEKAKEAKDKVLGAGESAKDTVTGAGESVKDTVTSHDDERHPRLFGEVERGLHQEVGGGGHPPAR